LRILFKHIATIVLSLVLIELILRLTGIVQPLWTVVDKDNGKLFKTKENLIFYNEGFSLTQSDGNGFVSYDSNKEGAKTLTFYGDSYSEAHQVFYRHHFLHALSNKKVPLDCINLSMSDFDFTDSYARYMIFDSILSSDHAYFFLSDDDFDQDDTDPFIPSVHLENEQLKLSDIDSLSLESSKVKYIAPLLRKSALLYLIRNAIRQIEMGNSLEILFDGQFTKKVSDEAPDQIISPVVYKILRNWDRRHCTIIYRGKRPMSKEYLDILQSYQIPLINLEQELRKRYNGRYEDLYYHKGTGQSGHWNLEAHQLISTILYEKLNRRFR